MFKLPTRPAVKSTLLTFTLALSAFSLNAQATLTSYTSDGKELVYSSVSNVTWTKDANLLKTMYDADNTLISKIAAVTPTYNDPFWGLQTISDGYVGKDDYDVGEGDYYDFNISAYTGAVTATWWGALAFVNYLNHISYAGSTQWYLPTVANTIYGYNTPTNGTVKGDELVELYYQELGSKAYSTGYGGINDPNNTFDNEQGLGGVYWSGTEYEPDDAFGAWGLSTGGEQDVTPKFVRMYVWAVSPGQIAAVPEADTTGMLLAGLGVVAGVVRRRQTKTA